MRTLLILSPHFPPVSAADMHRVRMGLPYFREFGWSPVVLSVWPERVEGVQEPSLLETVPADVPVRRVKALPARWTRNLGIGDVGLRAFPYLYRAGVQLIREHHVDLVFVSTTVFFCVPLARLWKMRLGVRFVVDMQDPWAVESAALGRNGRRGLKHRVAASLHRRLEPWTMADADGLIAVSADYIAVLRARYPRLAARPAKMVPFGASQKDFDLARARPAENRFFSPGRGGVHGVYVGRGGADMSRALRIIFQALRLGLERKPELFRGVTLHFIGTDYAPVHRARKTVEPVAEEVGVAAHVNESTGRIPYFEALRLLLEADFLLLPSSDDPQYSASKIYPYVLSGKPVLGVCHERSALLTVARATQAAAIVPFGGSEPDTALAMRFLDIWSEVLASLPTPPGRNRETFRRYTAREIAREECQLFDEVLARAPAGQHRPDVGQRRAQRAGT